MSAIYILWLRELKRYMRSRAQIVASLGQPMLYLLVLGFGLGPGLPARGQRQLSAVHRARRHRHDASCSRRSSPDSACSGTASSASSKRCWWRRCRASQIMIGRTLGGMTVA